MEVVEVIEYNYFIFGPYILFLGHIFVYVVNLGVHLVFLKNFYRGGMENSVEKAMGCHPSLV